MRRILIATEGSPCSVEAIRHFCRMLDARPTTLIVLAVIPPLESTGSHFSAEEGFRDECIDAEDALADAMLELIQTGREIIPLCREGEPAETILAVARERDVDLIVLGTHGPEARVDLAQLSVAEAVLHEAPCGVWIYPLRAARRLRAQAR